MDWDRPGVVRVTLKVPELAALVAGARLAAAALAAQSDEQAAELEQVLRGFERSVAHLHRPVGVTAPHPATPRSSPAGPCIRATISGTR